MPKKAAPIRRRKKRFKINGQWWTVIIGRIPCKDGRHGDCNAETRTIRLSPKALQLDAIDLIVHEVGHAVLWSVDEEFIGELGRVASQVAGWVGKAQGGQLSHGYSGKP